MNPTPSAPLLAILATLSLGGRLAAASEVEIIARSPFTPAAAASQPAAQSGPIELRGVRDDGDGPRFSIRDTARDNSYWVGLNETGYSFRVTAHRLVGGRDEVIVEYQGRQITLPLRISRVTVPRNATPMPAASAVPVSPAVTPTLTRNVTTTPTQASEQARLQDIANELERRRQLRSEATSGASAPSPGSQ